VVLDDQARVALINEALERISQQHQLRLNDPNAEPADPEAIFLDAAVNAVKPISDAAASVRAGAAAGEAAAAAFFATLDPNKKRPIAAVTSPLGSPSKAADGDGPKPKNLKRQERRQAEAARKAAAAGTTPATALNVAAPSIFTNTAVPQITHVPPAAAANKAPKLEPLAAGDPKPGTIVTFLDQKGSGLVEILERIHQMENPTKRIHELACGWATGVGNCRNSASKGCAKCDNKATASPAALSRAKAACSVALMAKLDPAAPVKMAA
jgi:hypothetical protein